MGDGWQVASETPAAPNLLDQARSQYPVLKNYDYGYVENFQPNAGFLEHWEPDDPGAEPTGPEDLNRLRPAELPMGKHGLEIRDQSTSPGYVAADIVSHHLKDVDPVVKGTYQQLQNSMTPKQQAKLREQYTYAQEHEGAKESFEDWKERDGLPGWLRGYAFQQWPKDFTDAYYTPEQRASLDKMVEYLKRQPSIKPTSEQPQGSGIWQVLKDYPAHVQDWIADHAR